MPFQQQLPKPVECRERHLGGPFAERCAFLFGLCSIIGRADFHPRRSVDDIKQPTQHGSRIHAKIALFGKRRECRRSLSFQNHCEQAP